MQQLVGKRGLWEPDHGQYSPQYDDKEEKKDNWILAENGHSGIWTVDYKFQRITRYSGIFRSQILRRIGGYKDKNMNKLVIWGKKIIKRISIHIICFSSLNIINTVCSWQICPNNPRRDPASHYNLNLRHSLLATETIDTPYLDGIWTHRGRVSSVIRPALYLQATTAGLDRQIV